MHCTIPLTPHSNCITVLPYRNLRIISTSCIIRLNLFCRPPTKTGYISICPNVSPCSIILIPHSKCIPVLIYRNLRFVSISYIIRLNQFCRLPTRTGYISICPNVAPCAIILIPHSNCITVLIYRNLRFISISYIIRLNQFCRLPTRTGYISICPNVVHCTIPLTPHSNCITVLPYRNLRIISTSCIICLNQFCRLPTRTGYISICPDVSPCSIILIPHSKCIAVLIYRNLREKSIS